MVLPLAAISYVTSPCGIQDATDRSGFQLSVRYINQRPVFTSAIETGIINMKQGG